MQTKDCIEKYKKEFEEEIKSLFWTSDGALKKKIYGKVKEEALNEIVNDVFVYDDDLLKSLIRDRINFEIERLLIQVKKEV